MPGDDTVALSGKYGLVSMLLNEDRYPLAPRCAARPAASRKSAAGSRNGLCHAGSRSTLAGRGEVFRQRQGFTMRGDRFKPLTYEQMTPEQRKMTDIAVAQRGTGGSFNISLRDPEGGQFFFDMGDRVGFHMSVPDKLKELAVTLTARYWGAQFEWFAHRRAAVQAGLTEDKVKAIAEGRRPLRPGELSGRVAEAGLAKLVCSSRRARCCACPTGATTPRPAVENTIQSSFLASERPVVPAPVTRRKYPACIRPSQTGNCVIRRSAAEALASSRRSFFRPICGSRRR
jgi:Carboxymuconolactone decarboxylase family